MIVDFIFKVINKIEGKKETKFKGRELKKISEIGQGGFGFIYLVEDGDERLALKILNIHNEEFLENVKMELSVWEKMCKKNSKTIKLIDWEIDNHDESYRNENKTSNIATAKILMEFCPDGNLLNYINNKKGNFSELEILSIVYEICLFLKDMHSLNPPVAHRDIKPENILKFKHNYKICDFGSCSSEILNYKTCQKKDIIKQHDIFDRFCTFVYRPPEMIDKLSQSEVNLKVDIWMLGCLTYIIAFKKHPFENAQKLTIINCAYTFPNNNYSEKLQDFIRLLLNPVSESRPSINELIEIIEKWDKINEINLSDECLEIKSRQTGVKIIKTTNKIEANKSLSDKEIEDLKNEINTDDLDFS